MIKLKNYYKNYEWGSNILIQKWLGINEPNKIAEVWIGDHKNSPSIDASTNKPLNESLKYMIKLLAASKPLSIQVHPNKNQAEKGYKKDKKIYTDSNEKEEMIYALSEFESFAGVKKISTIKKELKQNKSKLAIKLLQEIQKNNTEKNIINLIKIIFSASVKEIEEYIGLSNAPFVGMLSTIYERDFGVVLASLLNYYKLMPGEGIYLPAGIIHSYISGLGIEVLSSSDNVIRGGMTVKEINKNEFLKIANCKLGVEKFKNPLTNDVYKKTFKHWKFYDIYHDVNVRATLGFILSGEYESADGIKYKAGDGIYSENGEISIKAKLYNSRGVFVL